MDYYENWETFITHIDILPAQLDGEKLIEMASRLSRTREERELLGKKGADGDKKSLESFVSSYLPMIIENMKKYLPQVGYDRDVLIHGVGKVWDKVASILYTDNLEHDIYHYIEWMVKNDLAHYVAAREEHRAFVAEEEAKQDPLEELLAKVDTLITDEKQAEMIRELLQACNGWRERAIIAYRFGLEDGDPKTLEETGDRYRISADRVRRIETNIFRRVRVAKRKPYKRYCF